MNKKLFKKCCTLVMAMVVLCTAFAMPSASSWIFDFEVFNHNVYFQQLIDIDAKVTETVSGNTKSNVYITGMGQSPCYVKAMVVFTALDKDGNVISDADFSFNDIDLKGELFGDSSLSTTNTDDVRVGQWLSISSSLVDKQNELSDTKDGKFLPYIFICNAPLNYGDKTPNLIDSVTINSTEYDIKIEILVDSIYEGEVSEWLDTYGLTLDNSTRLLSLA